MHEENLFEFCCALSNTYSLLTRVGLVCCGPVNGLVNCAVLRPMNLLPRMWFFKSLKRSLILVSGNIQVFYDLAVVPVVCPVASRLGVAL